MKTLLMITLALTSSLAVANVKVGLVNIQKIIVTVKEGKTVNQTLEKSYKAKKKLIEKEEKAIMKLQEQFKKQDAVLSNAAKAKKSQEIAQRIQKVRQTMDMYQKEIRKQEAELKKPILERLKPIIDQVSKTEKVTVTFEISASPIVYAENKVDITDKVIKAYDKKHSK